ncbi:MAG: T9SS type A sorting domain-containing protein [Ignavibacteriales bacterium]|nr:T9SS type A sorting domain-containing protein [Ignavibacteriales bacterium]
MRLSILTLVIILLNLIIIDSGITSAQTATLEPTLSLVDVNGIKIPYQNGFPLPTFEKQSRAMINLAGDWKKQRFAANDNISLSKRDALGLANIVTEAANRHLSTFDDTSWETKTLPGVENKMNTFPKPPEFYTDGIWYRKTFNVDAANAGKFIKLIFYSVNYICDVWINDQYVGYHEGGYTPFAFDVSSKLNYGGINTIAVRVDNIAWGTRNDIVPYTIADWFNYSGILHDVYLEIASTVSVVRTNVIPKDLEGNLETNIVIFNKKTSPSNVTASVRVYEALINQNNIQSEFAKDIIGNEVTLTGITQNVVVVSNESSTVWKTNLKITNPKLWSPKQPNLYVAKITLTENGNIVDEYYTQFGIRTVGTNQGKFTLNDRIMFLPGVARHEEHPLYGRSVPKDIIYSDLNTIKSLNAIYVRTAHYPNHPYTYLIADRLGLAIMEEIPVYWFDTPESFNIQNNQRHIHQQMFREMVFKDYNRPSVIMWSTSNECKEVAGRLVYHNIIKEDYKTNYNDGRLLTQSAAADRPGPNDPTMPPLDVAGWTLYYGIFYGASGSYLGPTFSFLNNAKTANPNKPIIDTEFGYWSSENGSTTNEQSNVLTQTFNAFKLHTPYDAAGNANSNGFLMGTTWWCVFDWYQYKSNGYQTMGLISMDRQTEKPVAANLRSTYLPYASKDGLIVSVEENPTEKLPAEFRLEQNYPNPFNPETTIQYTIPSVETRGGESLQHVILKVYDILGREVATLVDEIKQPGVYHSTFSTLHSAFTTGVYFYRLTADKYSLTKKMLLIK